MPLFEIVGTLPDIPNEKKISMKKIRKMHETQFKFECSLGTMYLRRLTLFDYEDKQLELTEKHPEYEQAIRTSAPLREILTAGGSLEAAQMEQLQDAKKTLTPYAQEFAVCCFIEPKLEGSMDLSHLLFEMVPQERLELLEALKLLSNAAPDGKIDTAALAISKAFGIKLFDEDMSVEKMPAQVAVALLNVLADEKKKAENG
jgi:hypothetical protein